MPLLDSVNTIHYIHLKFHELVSLNDLFLSFQKVKEEETVLNKILFLYMHSYPDTPLGKLLCLFFSFFIIYWKKC